MLFAEGTHLVQSVGMEPIAVLVGVNLNCNVNLIFKLIKANANPTLVDVRRLADIVVHCEVASLGVFEEEVL